MSRYVTKGQHFSNLQVWFEDECPTKGEMRGVDTLQMHASASPCFAFCGKRVQGAPQHTLWTDLTRGEDELYLLLGKTVRNEVNRAKREEVKVDGLGGLASHPGMLDIMEETYNGMCREKGLGWSFPRAEVASYDAGGGLLMSVAWAEDSPAVFHTYVLAGRTARLYQSCSEFRFDGSAHRNAISRANRYLHWCDMLELKGRGFKTYDWGGVGSLENPGGIDKFKMGFGGEGLTLYNGKVAVSLKAKVWKTVCGLRGRKF